MGQGIGKSTDVKRKILFPCSKRNPDKLFVNEQGLANWLVLLSAKPTTNFTVPTNEHSRNVLDLR